jgi:hypothetical protein
MIENLKDMPRPGTHQRVVERGAHVDKNQGEGEDGATDDVQGISAR